MQPSFSSATEEFYCCLVGRRFIGLSLAMAALIWVVLSSAIPAASQRVDSLSSIGGECRTIAVQSEYAFLGEGPLFTVIDISDSRHLTEVARLPMPEIITNIHLHGSLAYVSVSRSGLKIIDVSSPRTPKLKSTYSCLGPADIDTSGTAMLMTRGDIEASVLDITNPLLPKRLAIFPLPYDAFMVQYCRFSGSHAVIGGQNGIAIYDVSNLSNPTLLAEVELDAVAGIDVSDSLLVACGFYSWDILDISDPAHPQSLFHSYSLNDYFTSIDIRGSTLLMGIQPHGLPENGGIRVLDISSPCSPALLGSVRACEISDMAWTGDSAFCASDVRCGVRVIDLSEPTHPRQEGELPRVGIPYYLDVRFPYLYSNATDGIRVLNIADPQNPRLVGNITTANQASDYVRSGSCLFVAEGSAGLGIYDVSRETTGVLVGRYDFNQPGLRWGADKLDVANTTAFVFDYCMLSIMDVSNPARPTRLSTSRRPSETINFALVHGLESNPSSARYLINGIYSYPIDVIDVSDPANPSTVTLNRPLPIGWRIAVDESTSRPLLYVGPRYEPNVVRIYDISTITDPVEVGSFAMPESNGGAMRIIPSNGFAYVCGQQGRLSIYDTANPAACALAGYQELAQCFEGNSDMATRGSLAYIASNRGGIMLNRLSGARIKDAEILRHTIPAQMAAGETVLATVTVRNYGTLTWSEAVQTVLSVSHDPSLVFGELRPTWDMDEGETVLLKGDYTFEIQVTAPERPGDYTFDLQMAEAVTLASAPSGAGMRARKPDSAISFFGQEYPVHIKVLPVPNSSSDWNLYR